MTPRDCIAALREYAVSEGRRFERGHDMWSRDAAADEAFQARVRWKVAHGRLAVWASQSGLVFDYAPVPELELEAVIAIVRPSWVLATPIVLDRRAEIFVSEASQAAQARLREWLATPMVSALVGEARSIAHLARVDRGGGVSFYTSGVPERGIEATLGVVLDLASAVTAIATPALPARVPEAFARLQRFVDPFGTADDGARVDVVDDAPTDALVALVAELAALDGEVTALLERPFEDLDDEELIIVNLFDAGDQASEELARRAEADAGE